MAEGNKVAAQQGSRVSVTGVELHNLRAPCHSRQWSRRLPVAFIREEIRDEVGLSLSEAAKVLECAALPCRGHAVERAG